MNSEGILHGEKISGIENNENHSTTIFPRLGSKGFGGLVGRKKRVFKLGGNWVAGQPIRGVAWN